MSLSMISQEILFKATTDRKEFGLQEQVTIEFSMNQENENFIPPSFENFTKVTGPNQSINNQYINGKHSYTKTITYTLLPKKTGIVYICEGQAIIKGKTYGTQPIELTVKNDTSSSLNDTDIVITDYKNKIHIITNIASSSKLNDTIAVSYKLLISNDISLQNWEDKIPNFKHFKIIDHKKFELEVNEEEYLNKEYRSVIVRKFDIIPIKKGLLKLEKYTMSIDVSLPTNKKDVFGRPILAKKKAKIYGEEPQIRIY